MKDYEVYSSLKVPKNSKIIVRLDGRSFHKLAKDLNLTKPYDDNPYWQWDSIYDGGKLYTDESANGYRLATLDEIVHIANWNISNGFELQSYSGINEWCDAYAQNNCETGIFTANIADSSEEYFENCVTYHKHNAHESPGDIIIGGEEVYCCGGGENFTQNLGFRVVRNAPENP